MWLSNTIFYCFDVPAHLFNQFPIDGHLGCFQCFAITNIAVTNIFTHMSVCTCENIAVGLIPISEIAMSLIILIDIATLSFSEVILI